MVIRVICLIYTIAGQDYRQKEMISREGLTIPNVVAYGMISYPSSTVWVPWGDRFRSGPRLQREKDEKEDEIRRHNRQTEEVNRQIVNAERMKSDVIEMTKLVAEATNKTDGITRAWQVLETNYESVIYALRTDGSNRATIVRRLLVVAINDWNKLARNAFAIKRQASQNR
jgi:hypothetical protein